ncbi:putative reverse transcriptase domain-containing protein [Tanacetum coccineum]
MPSEHHIPLRPICYRLVLEPRFAMSSDKASFAVTYTSISSDSNGPSWGIPLMNAGELSKMDPYEEVKGQPYLDDASLNAESPAHIADSESIEEDSIDYPDEPEDDDEDPEEDLEEDHTDYPANGEDGDDEPSDDDEDEDPTGDKEEEEHLDSADFSAVPVVDPVPSAGDTEAFKTYEAWKTVRLELPMSASMEACIAEHAAAPIPPTSPAYDQVPLGHRAAMIRMRDDIPEEDMQLRRRFVLTAPPPGCDVAKSFAAAVRTPRGQYDFVDTVEAGQGLIRSPGHDARTIARGADRAEDVGYVKALQAFERRMMTSMEEVNLRINYQAQVRRRENEDFYTQLHDAQTDRIDIRLEIDVVRGQRTAYETELHEVRQAYLSFEARNMALLARLKTPETHMSRMEWQRQSAKDFADHASQSSGRGLRRPVQPACVSSYTDFMKCQPLNFNGTEGVVGLSQWLKKMESIFHISGCAIDNQVKFATCTLLGNLKKKLMDKYYPKGEIKKLEIELWNLKVRRNDIAAYTQCFQELALMCTKFLADETKKVDKYISGLPDNIHGNVMSARPKTLDDAIELANNLIDQKLRTYAERQNDNKRKDNDSSRNNQQPHKKQNVARAYTAGPGQKKAYTGNLPLCTKCNYHHTRKCAPKCGNCKRYGHTTNDFWVNTNNNNKNQKAGACYECGNTGHIKKNCPKLKIRENGNGNGVA